MAPILFTGSMADLITLNITHTGSNLVFDLTPMPIAPADQPHFITIMDLAIGLGLPRWTNSGAADSKMNGPHGPKHKRGDVGRECKPFRLCPWWVLMLLVPSQLFRWHTSGRSTG
jgi:hypothetical protein